MDPNANLNEQRNIIARMLADGSESIDTGDAVRLAELARALDEWMSNIQHKSFPPSDWDHSYDHAVYLAKKREEAGLSKPIIRGPLPPPKK
jgi:hypothetical protein